MQRDRQIGEGERLRAQRLDTRLEHQLDGRLDGGEAEDRRRPREEALDPRSRLVARAHLELLPLAEPALDRRAQPLLQVAPHVEERRRPRPGIEVLVGAPDGQLRLRQVDRDDAGRVAQVPEHQRAGAVHGGGDRGDVGERARPVADHGQDDERRALGRRVNPVGLRPGDRVGREPAQLERRAAPRCPRARSGRSETRARRRRPRRGAGRARRRRACRGSPSSSRTQAPRPAAPRCSRAMRSPTRTGSSIQSAQPPTSRSPHSATSASIRSAAACGSRPSELPSA